MYCLFFQWKKRMVEFDIEYLVEFVSIDLSDIKDRIKVICKY